MRVFGSGISRTPLLFRPPFCGCQVCRVRGAHFLSGNIHLATFWVGRPLTPWGRPGTPSSTYVARSGPPFCVRRSEPMPRPGSACMGVGFLYWLQPCNRPPFLGVALRLPRRGRAPSGVPSGVPPCGALRNAKVRPDVRPPLAQRPARPFCPGIDAFALRGPVVDVSKSWCGGRPSCPPGRRHDPEEGAAFAPAVCALPRCNGTVPRAGTAPTSSRP